MIAAAVVGCSGGGEDAPEDTPIAPVQTSPAQVVTPESTAVATPVGAAVMGTPMPTVTPVVASSSPLSTRDATPAFAPTPTEAAVSEYAPTEGYDSVDNMYRLFSGEGHDAEDSLEAIELATLNRDKSMTPLLIEMLRFYDDYVLAIESRKALAAITGREVEGNEGSWSNWMEWLVHNLDEYGPPDGYLEWKMTVMSLIDPRFREFLAPVARGSAVDPVEIAWGGVEPDGIPDLQNAPVVSVEEQDYLKPGDRVFGVSINGEHRAYPLRIVNAHEMANDVLGGEPISLAY